MDISTLKANVSSALQYGKALQGAANLLPGFIASAETLLPEKGQGQQKLAMVQDWIEGALAWEGHAAEVIKAVWPKIEPSIAVLVTLYTHNGVFASILNQTVPAAALAAPAAAA